MTIFAKIIQVISFLLSLIIVLCTVNIGVISIYANDENSICIEEEKIYSTATVDGNFAEDRILVMFKNEVSLQLNEYQVSDFPEIDCKTVKDMSRFDAQRVKSKIEQIQEDSVGWEYSAQTANNSDIISNYNQIVCIELENAGKENVINAIKELQKRDDILYVGPDYEISLCSSNEQYIPDDEYYHHQWAPSKIQLLETWAMLEGRNTSTVTVGVLDTGIDGSHDDLDEIIDDDYCRDFTSGNVVVTGKPTDDNGHGTHVAGIIGAIGDNAEYIAGACWDVELVSLKVFNKDGDGYASHLINAINWVSEYTDIQILNFSGIFTGTGTDDEGNYWFESTDLLPLQEKIDAYNGLFVCAAGNSNLNNDLNARYPANYAIDNMITVGASNSNDGIWYESDVKASNYGATNVDLFAPGADIYSLWEGNGSKSDSGTSMAAPYVTGVAAILLSIAPTLTPEDLKSYIMNNVDKASDGVSAFTNLCVSQGRLNAYKAVADLLTCPHATVTYDTTELYHTAYCASCAHLLYNSSHSWQYGSYDQSGHSAICTVCSYYTTQSHNLYVYSDNGESGSIIKCNQCDYTWYCFNGMAEYDYAGTNGHYVNCTCGCYAFLTPHKIIAIMQSSSTAHSLYCEDCATLYYVAHSWVPLTYGYECAVCGMYSDSIPGAMQIPPDDELLIASNDDPAVEDALLPEKEEDLVTE